MSENSGKTTTAEFVRFAREMREMGATFVRVGALEAHFPAPQVVFDPADIEPTSKHFIEPLGSSERGELEDLRRMRDNVEEFS